MSGSDWARRTRRGIVWSVLSFSGGRALTFLATLILARLLAPSEFGVVAAILAFLALLELGSDLGMKATVVYEQERRRTGSERLDTAFTINLALALVLCAVGVVAAPAIAGFFEVEGEAGLFRLAALFLLITGLANIHDAVLMRELDFRRRIVPELVRGLVRGGVAVGLALAGLGAAALVWGLLAGQAAWAAVLWVITAYRPHLRFDPGIARSMSTYGVASAALQVVAVLGTRAAVIVIGKLLGPAALGLYTIAARVPELAIGGVSWSFSNVAFPALARMRELDRAGLRAATGQLVRYQALATVPLATLLAVLASPAVVVAFSAKWAAAGPVMAAVSVAAALEALGYPLGDLLKSIARQRLLLVINLINLPLMVAAMVLVAPVGLSAVAWALAAQSLLHLVMLGGATRLAAGVGLGLVLRAAAPALVFAAGIGAGAGAVRLLWSEESVGPLLAGLAAGALGGWLAGRLFAPATLAELRGYARSALAGGLGRGFSASAEPGDGPPPTASPDGAKPAAEAPAGGPAPQPRAVLRVPGVSG